MKVIEVYIKTEERLQPPPGGSYKDYDAHPCLQKHNIKKTIPSDVERMLRVLEAAAAQKGMTLKIYDITTRIGKVRAFIKGVKTIPLTIIGDKRIEGIADSSELKYL